MGLSHSSWNFQDATLGDLTVPFFRLMELVPQLQLGNAEFEALFRHPAFPPFDYSS